MKVKIRKYRDADYAACRSLFGELSQHHAEIYEDSSIAGDDPGRGFDKHLSLSNLRGIWVAEVNGKVVGFTGLLEYLNEEGVVEIDPLVVSVALRDKGIGSKLVEYVKQKAKEKAIGLLLLEPDSGTKRLLNSM